MHQRRKRVRRTSRCTTVSGGILADHAFDWTLTGERLEQQKFERYQAWLDGG